MTDYVPSSTFSSPSPPLVTSARPKRKRTARLTLTISTSTSTIALPSPAPLPATTLVLPSGEHVDLLDPSPFAPVAKGEKFAATQVAVLEAAYDDEERTIAPTVRPALATYLNISRRRLTTWIDKQRRRGTSVAASADCALDGTAAKEEWDDKVVVGEALAVRGDADDDGDDDGLVAHTVFDKADEGLVSFPSKRRRLESSRPEQQGLIYAWGLESQHAPTAPPPSSPFAPACTPAFARLASSPRPFAFAPSCPTSPSLLAVLYQPHTPLSPPRTKLAPLALSSQPLPLAQLPLLAQPCYQAQIPSDESSSSSFINPHVSPPPRPPTRWFRPVPVPPLPTSAPAPPAPTFSHLPLAATIGLVNLGLVAPPTPTTLSPLDLIAISPGSAKAYLLDPPPDGWRDLFGAPDTREGKGERAAGDDTSESSGTMWDREEENEWAEEGLVWAWLRL